MPRIFVMFTEVKLAKEMRVRVGTSVLLVAFTEVSNDVVDSIFEFHFVVRIQVVMRSEYPVTYDEVLLDAFIYVHSKSAKHDSN